MHVLVTTLYLVHVHIETARSLNKIREIDSTHHPPPPTTPLSPDFTVPNIREGLGPGGRVQRARHVWVIAIHQADSMAVSGHLRGGEVGGEGSHGGEELVFVDERDEDDRFPLLLLAI